MPDGTNRVDDVPRGKPVSFCQNGATGGARGEVAQLFEQLGASGSMNRSVNSAAAAQRFVCRVDNRVDAQRRYVSLEDCDYKPACQLLVRCIRARSS